MEPTNEPAEISSATPAPELAAAIADARDLAREQVAAAWQLQVDRIREQLETGWRDQIDGIFEERFIEIQQRLSDSFEAGVDERVRNQMEQSLALARASSRRELTERLNQAARRLKNAETREIWIQTLLDSATDFCAKAALFAIRSKNIRFEGVSGAAGDRPRLGLEFPIAGAPAFGNAAGSLDTVIAMGTPREVSPQVAELLGDASHTKIYLFPIVLANQTVAILYTEPGEESIDVSALELLASVASGSIQTEVVSVARQPELIRIEAAPAVEAAPLPPGEQEAHLKAQRFARSQVAQLVLYKSARVRVGRTTRDIYGALQQEIDQARASYRQSFKNVPDYYHQELIRALAREDAALMGPDYPGPIH